ncbi:hypothetical protein F3Y22_tig00110236pilonHSYRG00096 [Hibiscus syriacus]|uniref:Transmembrane protein n=1 Tax=Hibiscus syriacus TaxID=106335 RepID=A0A6A3BAM0_HIBSY|nr:hypothetical protein F3Y22_tig00110236pilonHSYRG00096 [Hibiscus syriacus]
MEEYSYNDQQNSRDNLKVPLCRVVLIFVFLYWLCTCVDISSALSNKPLHIFIFINFIIFALFVLSSQKQLPSQRNCDCISDNVDPRPSLEDDEHCRDSEEILVDKHVILVENAVGEIVALSSDNSGECFGRNHRRHHQRLEGRMSKELVISMRELPARRIMDDMSNEEFRFALEAFIDGRNKVMKQEKIDDDEEAKKEYVF